GNFIDLTCFVIFRYVLLHDFIAIVCSSAPEVPSILQAYSKTSQSITVEFKEVPGANSYILRAESLTGDYFDEMPVDKSPGTVEGLDSYTVYKLSVLSVNVGGRSQPSYPIEARTVVEAPILNTTSLTNNTIHVGWEPVEHAVLYTLCIIEEGSNVLTKINTTDTEHIFDDLKAGTNYCITGTAWDSDSLAGDGHNICQVTLLRQIPFFPYTPGPADPELIDVFVMPGRVAEMSEPETSNCSVVWGGMPLAEYYMVYIKSDDGVEKVCNTTETTCPFFCMCGFTYISSVFPYNSAGSNLYSPMVSYTTVPCCPQGITIKLVSTETLEITWDPVTGADLYETTAAETGDVIHCNDTASVCALSDLNCDTSYSVTITPCNDLRGCNTTCKPHVQDTAPCAPEILSITQFNSTTYKVQFTTPNRGNTDYIITARGSQDTHTCRGTDSPCELTQLPCGSSYEVMGVASSSIGQSLPGYNMPLETGPCCPLSVNVTQVTQAMSNMSWTPGKGARTFIASLEAPRGHASCHTQDTHCLVGCVTCGTKYSVHMEAISSTGHQSECQYSGFSTSACCPTNIKLQRQKDTSIKVMWRTLGSSNNSHVVELYGTGGNLTCTAPAGTRFCNVTENTCGDVYTVQVAPVGNDGVKVSFCQAKMYSGESCKVRVLKVKVKYLW
uniref:Fibronectin type III domain containing 7a n=1 Tax=Sphaeramia orbicularis TaxID=375764 RepID=A0A673ALZ8_9TELE